MILFEIFGGGGGLESPRKYHTSRLPPSFAESWHGKDLESRYFLASHFIAEYLQDGLWISPTARDLSPAALGGFGC